MIDHLPKTELSVVVDNTLKTLQESILTQCNILEQTTEQLITERDLFTARGVQLDHLGYLIGENRNGRNDDDYLKGLKLRLAINTSSGTVNELIEILQLLLGDGYVYRVTRSGDGAVDFYLGVETPVDDFLVILSELVSAGVLVNNVTYSQAGTPFIATERGATGDQSSGILPEIGEDGVVLAEKLI